MKKYQNTILNHLLCGKDFDINLQFLFDFRPYLNAGKRELLADYSLPVSVIIMSVFGALAFKDVTSEYSL